jgi:predicted small secreted protein
MRLCEGKKGYTEMFRKLLLIILLAFLLLLLTNCQTVQGIGGDIKWTGQKSAEVIEGL